MNYLIVQDWPATHDNHAGMVHMCRLLVEKYPHNYTVLVKKPIRNFRKTDNWLLRKIIGLQAKYYSQVTFRREYITLCKPMFERLRDGDKVFLLEYMFPFVSQLEIAQLIKKRYLRVKVYGLCHLTQTFFKDAMFYPKILKTWPAYVDKLLTFGHSLTEYFVENGVSLDMISTGKHYADVDFYHIDQPKPCTEGLITAIVMGGMQRDYNMLTNIVKGTPNVHWVICRGRNEAVDEMMNGCSNVTLKGFMAERDLRSLMAEADLSVNIMVDTVGSNVIATSLAMGLAMVCSDVGSIRDYCDEKNTVFCRNTETDFIVAINTLAQAPALIMAMKEDSWHKSNILRIENVDKWFNEL